MLIVNVEKYSDFSIPVTISTWMSHDYNSLSQTGLSNAQFDNDREVKNAERELRNLGFKKIKAAVITVGGNL